MKKMFIKIMALVIIFIMSLSMVTFADQKPITVFLDGTQLEFDVPPMLENGRTLVPMRVIFEALGATVDWDNDTFTAIATKDDLTIKITIDDMKLYKNDEVIELDVPARLIDGRTLVPARAVSEGMGAKVDWDNDDWVVTILTTEQPVEETPDEPSKPEKTYKYNELSEADKEKLEKSSDKIRRTFEQVDLSELIFKSPDVVEMIIEKNSYIPQEIEKCWNSTWIAAIKDIQKNSDNNYVGIDDEGTDEDYIKLIEDLGYGSENFYTTEFIKTSFGNSVFLIKFKDGKYDTEINCKYIGIVSEIKYYPHYFTAETNPHIQDKYFFCELLYRDDEHGTYYEIEMTRNEFLKAIDDVLQNEVPFRTTIDLSEDEKND